MSRMWNIETVIEREVCADTLEEAIELAEAMVKVEEIQDRRTYPTDPDMYSTGSRLEHYGHSRVLTAPQGVKHRHTLVGTVFVAEGDRTDPVYDDGDRCVRCRQHFADPHTVDCPNDEDGYCDDATCRYQEVK